MQVYKSLAGKVRTNFINNLQALFNNVGYEKSFNRETVEKCFGVKKSRALEIISILIDHNIVEYAQESKYRFKR